MITSRISEDTILANHIFLSILIGCFLIIFIFYKDVTNLQTVAFLGVCGFGGFLIFVIIDLLYSLWIEDIEPFQVNYWNRLQNDNIHNYFSSISTIILSFNFHSYTFYVYEYLHKPSNRGMMVASSVGFYITIIIYCTIGIIIYVLYGYGHLETLSDVYGNSSTIFLLMNISFVVGVIMSFPMSFAGLKFYLVGLMEMVYIYIKDKVIILKSNS